MPVSLLIIAKQLSTINKKIFRFIENNKHPDIRKNSKWEKLSFNFPTTKMYVTVEKI